MSTRRSWMCAAAWAVAGCAGRQAPPAPARAAMWPLPPDQPRYRHEATLRHAGSVRDGAEADLISRVVTGEDDRRQSFNKPFAVAAREGRIYVSDSEGRRIFVFDVPRRRIFSFGYRLEGELKKPAGLCVDAQGQVYVVDSTAKRLVVYDALGLFVSAIDGTRDWVRPTAVAVRPDGSQVFVVDTGGVESRQHRVWVYDRDGRAQATIGTRGADAGQFNLPTDAAVAPDGTLWVLDAGNFRVQAFDAQGRFVRQFGSNGRAIGQFARPRGLAVDGDGLVYVSDAMFCNIQVFQPDGQMLLAIGSRAETDAPGRYLLPAKIASDEGRRIYVVDQYLHKVEVIRRLTDEEGRRLQAMPVPGT